MFQLVISTSLARPRIINGEKLDDISDYLYRVSPKKKDESITPLFIGRF
jgi:hypothetical protein